MFWLCGGHRLLGQSVHLRGCEMPGPTPAIRVGLSAPMQGKVVQPCRGPCPWTCLCRALLDTINWLGASVLRLRPWGGNEVHPSHCQILCPLTAAHQARGWGWGVLGASLPASHTLCQPFPAPALLLMQCSPPTPISPLPTPHLFRPGAPRGGSPSPDSQHLLSCGWGRAASQFVPQLPAQFRGWNVATAW